MDHPLQGAMLKMNRAEEHLKTIGLMLEEFVKSDFYETVGEKDYKGRLVARAKNVKDPPPELSVLIGDCVFNFRSALDQLAYALASAHTDPLPEAFAKTSAFPIFNSGPTFRRKGAAGGRHKIRGMRPSTQAAIERLQPYHRRKRPLLAALWHLEELSNVDKHRLVHLTGTVGIRSRFGLRGVGFQQLTKIEPVFRPIEEKAVVGRFYGDFDLEAGVDVEAQIIPEVVFDRRSEARSIRGLAVFHTLLAIRNCIAFEIFLSKDLEPEFLRAFPGTGLDVSGRFV